MAKNKVIPADIQADADELKVKLFNSSVFLKSQSYILDYAINHYIQGRMDERAKSWTDEDMLKAFKGGLCVTGGVGPSTKLIENWLDEYKKNKK
jgi:predicted nucleotide-binding protein (sugar kinase/HSP70/actin superfamily)